MSHPARPWPSQGRTKLSRFEGVGALPLRVGGVSAGLSPEGRGSAETALLPAALGLCLTLLSVSGCDKDDGEQGTAPPPVATARPGVCDQGGGTVTDPVSAAYFPRKVGDYCLDPNGETRAYGKDAEGSLDKV